MYVSFGYLELDIWMFYRAADVETCPENFQNVFYISTSAYNLEVSKFWIFVLDVRCLEEKEAKVMEVFPRSTTTATYYWEASSSADIAYASSGAESAESTNWWSTMW